MAAKNRHIGFLAPWTDQGLGIQCRWYVRMLGRVITEDCHLHIIAYDGYNSRRPQDTSEWTGLPCNIHRIPKTQNDLIPNDVRKICRNNKIDTVLVLEPRGTLWECMHALFHKDKRRVIAIPNLEMLEFLSIEKMAAYEVWCNNEFTHRLLSKNCPRIKMVGFCIDEEYTKPQNIPRIPFELRLLMVCGWDIERRQVGQFLDALTRFADNDTSRIKVLATITTQFAEIPPEWMSRTPDNVQWVSGNTTHANLMRMYNSHDVAVVLSKHEGLGLTLYESIAHGVPVITMNANPHKELIIDGINGWLLPTNGYEMIKNNKDPVVESVLVSSRAIANTIQRLVETYSTENGSSNLLTTTAKTTHLDYTGRFRPVEYPHRLAGLLDLKPRYVLIHEPPVLTPGVNLIETFFDEIYVINLERRKDRWDRTSHRMHEHGISRFTRFVGTDLGSAKGIAHTHARLFREAIEKDREWILILEDDIAFHKQFSTIITAGMAKVPLEASVLYLGAHSTKKIAQRRTGSVFWHDCSTVTFGDCPPHWYGAYAMAVHKSAFRRLAKAAFDFYQNYDSSILKENWTRPIDSADGELGKIQREGGGYVLIPCPIDVHLDESDVEGRHWKSQPYTRWGVCVDDYQWQ
jgi:glycosyltransferase involved in cell wall biosynthesis